MHSRHPSRVPLSAASYECLFPSDLSKKNRTRPRSWMADFGALGPAATGTYGRKKRRIVCFPRFCAPPPPVVVIVVAGNAASLSPTRRFFQFFPRAMEEKSWQEKKIHFGQKINSESEFRSRGNFRFHSQLRVGISSSRQRRRRPDHHQSFIESTACSPYRT